MSTPLNSSTGRNSRNSGKDGTSPEIGADHLFVAAHRGWRPFGDLLAVIEHKLDVVAMLADRVIVLDHGEKIAEGPPAAVRRDEEVIRAYLGRSAAFA